MADRMKRSADPGYEGYMLINPHQKPKPDGSFRPSLSQLAGDAKNSVDTALEYTARAALFWLKL